MSANRSETSESFDINEIFFSSTELNLDLVLAIALLAAEDKNSLFNLSRTSHSFLKICQRVFDQLPVYFAVSNNMNIFPIIKSDNSKISSATLDASIKHVFLTENEFTLFSEDKLTKALVLQHQNERTVENLFGCGGIVYYYGVHYQPTLFQVKCKSIGSGKMKNSDALYFVSGNQVLEQGAYELPVHNIFKK